MEEYGSIAGERNIEGLNRRRVREKLERYRKREKKMA